MINKYAKELGEEPSKIRELFEEARILKELEGNDKVYDFSIGNPSVPAPIELKEELIDILNNEDPLSVHGYTPSVGSNKTRESIVSDLRLRFDDSLDAKYIYLTSGAASGLAITFNALYEDDKDEILVIRPHFPEYRPLTKKAGLRMVLVDCDKQFLPDFSDLRNKISPNTKALLINSPNNPSGVVYNEEIIKNIASLLKEKEMEFNHPIYLISDEPYRELIYNGVKYPFITRYYDDSIVIYSYSKSLSIPGERFGYVILSSKLKDVEDVFSAIKGSARSLGYICAPTIFQELLRRKPGLIADISEYKKNRNLLEKMFDELGYEYVKSDGAFYLLLKALEDDAKKFSLIAKKFNLFLVPTDTFGIEGYVRVSYCVKESVITNSYPTFKKLKEYYGKN